MARRLLAFCFVSIFVISAGCAMSGSGDERTGDDDRRGSLGKADHVTGSCASGNVCGGQSDGSCWCDSLCASYGDCCEDAAEACGVDECDADEGTGCHEGETCAAGSPNTCELEAGPCDPQDAGGVGQCEAFFGYRWNGSACVGVSGCSCEGAACDELTFDLESCEAAHASCDDGGLSQSCGGLTGAGCPSGKFCDYGSSCGTGDQSGTCTDQPSFCAQVYQPVCGCDGQTYGNACMAHASGVSIASAGECAAPEPEPEPATDTCEGHCGESSEDGSCWCDSLCESYGDCCDDKVAVCG